jgi:hypothetical protein
MVAGSVLAKALQRLTGGSPIKVTNALRTEAAGVVTVTGTTALFNVPQLAVTAMASNGPAGTILTVRFTLIRGFPGPNAWHFSQSFPNLPNFYAGSTSGQPSDQQQTNLLDGLVLSDGAFVLTTAEAAVDTVTGARLVPGLNFVAYLSPTGLLGLLDTLGNNGDRLVLSGPVVLPLPVEVTPPLPVVPVITFPWQVGWEVPGIHLNAALAGDTTLGGKLQFHDVALRIYCPVTKDWAAANTSYSPMAAASAKLDVPSAQLSLDLTALGVLSPDRLTLIGMFEGVTLNKLEDLVDAAGGGDLAAFLPQDVTAERLASTLGKLALQAITVDLGAGFKVGYLGLAIGIPDLDTTVLPGFVIDSLVANFTITNPFGTGRTVFVTVGGNVCVVGAPFGIYVDLPDVAATALLSAPTAVQLSKVAAEVGLPAPLDVANLTIDTMEFYADKAGSLSFSTIMAQNSPWSLDVGQITSVSATLTRPAGQTASGQFSGTLNLGGFAIGLSAAARGSNAGWLLNGYAEQPNGSYVPVGDFLSDLATKLGITVPDALVQAVQSLRIANLTITLDTQSKAFSFNGDTDAKGQTPLGLNTYDLDLRVNVSSAIDPTTKQRTSSGHLEADLTIGAALFVLSFDFGRFPTSRVAGSASMVKRSI